MSTTRSYSIGAPVTIEIDDNGNVTVHVDLTDVDARTLADASLDIDTDDEEFDAQVEADSNTVHAARLARTLILSA